MKRATLMLAAVVLLAAGAGRAKADSITYTIADVGTFGGYTDGNLSDTYSGTGFVGIYPGSSFAHLFGLENYSGVYSETEAQVNISALAGATINSATLSYTLLNGSAGSPQTVTATSFSANGTLGYSNGAPDDLGSVNFTSTALSSNSVDVTGLLSARVAASPSWFGLYLTPDGPGNNYQWTYTWAAGNNGNADSADVRLTVDYTPEEEGGGATPEPASMTLLGIGIVGMAGYGWRRRKLTVA